MARSLPAAITAALASGSAQPSLSVTVQDLRTRWTSTPIGTGSRRNGAILTSAGSIVRCAVTGTATDKTATTVNIYRTPAGSLSSPWPSTPVATPTTNAQNCAGACLIQSGSTIRCFWIDATSNAPKYSDSTDDGQTWGAAQTTIAAGPLTNNLCYGLMAKSTTDLICAYQDYSWSGAGWYELTYTTTWGSWSAAVGPATPTWGTIQGLSMAPDLATKVVVCGVQMRAQVSGTASAGTTLSGSTWSAMSSIADNDNPSLGLSCPWPAVHYSAGDGYYYSCVTLTDSGAVSGTNQFRTTIWRSLDGVSWSLWAVAGTAFGGYEVHCIIAGGTTYVFDNTTLLTSPAPSAALDVSADVLALHITERAQDHVSVAVLLSNASGQYTNAAQLRDNSTVQIALGYNGTTIATHTAYVDAWSVVGTPREQTVTVEGRGIQKLLDQISPRFIALSGKTIAQLVTQIATYAGVSLAALPGTSQFSQTVPCFVITPGESWLSALHRVSEIYDFDYFESGAPSPSLKIVERSAGDASSWSYGQETLGGSYQTSADQADIIRVVGATTGGSNVFAEVTDGSYMLATGAHRYRHIADRMLDTSAKCLLKGQLALRDEQTQVGQAALTVALNPGHEVMDVVSVTDSRLGLSGASLRIHEIRTVVDTQQGTFQQQLQLRKP